MIDISDYIPVRECGHKIKNDKVIVHYDKFEKTWLDKFIKPKKEKIAKIELDEIGSFIWLNCDGKNRVSTIVELSKINFPGKEKIEERVTLFLTQLENKKFIRFYTIK
ncbi:MAG TPA: PqqD family protein [Ignavibacteria bacterium]|nr:PqqD family protein [Ignavibacteria bacterium]